MGLAALIRATSNLSLEMELVSLPEDLEGVGKAQLDVLLFHSDGHDLEAVARLRKQIPTTRVLVFLDEPDEETELAALRAGASGCATRMTDPQILLRAFEVVGGGELWVSHRLASRAITELTENTNADSTPSIQLTNREWEILALLAKGSRNKDIANALAVSENTIKTHLGVIYRKINVDCRLAATLYYFRHAGTQESPASQGPVKHPRKKKPTGRAHRRHTWVPASGAPPGT